MNTYRRHAIIATLAGASLASVMPGALATAQSTQAQTETRTQTQASDITEARTLQPRAIPEDRSFEFLFGPNRTWRYFAEADGAPFQPDTETFCATNAWWLAEASLLAYVDDEAFCRAALARAGLPGCALLRAEAAGGDHTQCLIAHNGRIVIVAFRGSEPDQARDAWSDLNFLPARAADGEALVHQGFQAAYDAIAPALGARLDEVTSAGQRVWFTGHSLGGALALLAADGFAKRQPAKVADVYTFGCPRVGNTAFSRQSNVRHWRVVNGCDVVQHLPPGGVYFHGGTMVYLDRAGKIHFDPAAADQWQDQFSNLTEAGLDELERWRAGQWDMSLPVALIDHAPLHYAIRCWNAHLIKEP